MGAEGSKPTWHFSRGGKQYGPISDHELLQLTELGSEPNQIVALG